jgi:hypothetical protein
MIKFLFTPGIDTGTELAVGIYTENTLNDLREELLKLLDTGKPGDMLLVVKGQANGVKTEKDLLFQEITTQDQGIVPDMWKLLDSYVDWTLERGKEG